jgi:hypothetical protein
MVQTGLIIALLAVIIYNYFIKKQNKVLIAENEELTQAHNVSQEVERLFLALNLMLTRKDARDLVSRSLKQQDEYGEVCILSPTAESAWRVAKPIYERVYQFLFEKDFHNLKPDASLTDLVKFEVTGIDVTAFAKEVPEFKEKCLSILKAAIAVTKKYEELLVLHELAKSWQPFGLWAKTVDEIFEERASVLSVDEFYAQRNALGNWLSQSWGNDSLTVGKKLIFDAVAIINRELLNESAKKLIKPGYYDHLKGAVEKVKSGQSNHTRLKPWERFWKLLMELVGRYK